MVSLPEKEQYGLHTEIGHLKQTQEGLFRDYVNIWSLAHCMIPEQCQQHCANYEALGEIHLVVDHM